MPDGMFAFPAGYYCVLGLLGLGSLWAVGNARQGIGLPMLAVLFTIAVWYVVDASYNSETYGPNGPFPPDVLATAWWQVVTFLVVFLLITPPLHGLINGRLINARSHVMKYFNEGTADPSFQYGLHQLFAVGLYTWAIVLLGAGMRFGAAFPLYLIPFLGSHPGPWVTSGIGGGADTFNALANYLQLMVGAIFGMVSALSTNRRVRTFALMCVLLTWPFYIFDRTRKFILVVALPGVLSWASFRIRGGFVRKAVVLVVAFSLVNAWFGFIIEHRMEAKIVDVAFNKGFDFASASTEQHQGLNMYEELSWVTMFAINGTFSPATGADYIANLLNPIPRSLWPDKPTIGLDYSRARGMGGADNRSGVFATLSQGVVGQGVVNFGLYWGPAIAGLLASLWVTLLARIDLRGHLIGYVFLYVLGIVLTFTMGRDITFIEAYPFAFAYGIAWYLNGREAKRSRGQLSLGGDTTIKW